MSVTAFGAVEGATGGFESLFFPGRLYGDTFAIPDTAVAMDESSAPDIGLYRFQVPLTMIVLGASTVATFTSTALEIVVNDNNNGFDRIVAAAQKLSGPGAWISFHRLHLPESLFFELWEGSTNTLSSDALDFTHPVWQSLIGTSGANFSVTDFPEPGSGVTPRCSEAQSPGELPLLVSRCLSPALYSCSRSRLYRGLHANSTSRMRARCSVKS